MGDYNKETHEQILIHTDTKGELDLICGMLGAQRKVESDIGTRKELKPTYNNAIQHLFNRLDMLARKMGYSGGSEEVIGFAPGVLEFGNGKH